MPENEIPKTEWNLNQWKTNLIGENYKAGMNYFRQGYYQKSFGNWQTIRLTINSRIKPEDERLCEKYEQKIPTLIMKDPNYNKQVPSNNYKQLLKEYIKFVGKLLKSSGLDWTEKGEESLF